MSERRNKPTLLIVEDERNTREALARIFRPRYDVTLAEDGIRALNILKKNDFDVVLSDLIMPGADGLAVLKACREKEPAPACILCTAYGSIEKAVEAVKEGAFDFITKPLNYDRVELLMDRALETIRLREENRELRQRLHRKSGIENMTGKSAVMHEVFETIRQVAPTRATVLITGESGTGKELVAQALHQLSERNGKFVAVHCAALPDNLLETELFGHEKGAFTGAIEQKAGRFELADGGTLFLDEIGEIHPSIQVKLLRALETRTFERIGGVQTLETDTRVVAATNRDLRAMVERGEFREDLFYRLDVVRIHLPPLRDRQEDIPLLVKQFLDEFSRENGKEVATISEEALAAICAYDWPGNIRELRNCIERMVVLSRSASLSIENVPVHIREKSSPGISRTILQSSTLDLDRNERLLIEKALESCGGNRTQAAEKLGISRRTLHRKIHSLKLD